MAARAAGYGIPGVIVDGNDVLAVHEAAEALRDAGAKISLVLGVVDREEGAADAMKNAGFRFEALFTSSSLGLVI